VRRRIQSFDSQGPVHFSIVEEDAERETRVHWEPWFDRDSDGRWLVCAVNHRDADHNAELDHADDMGSIVVRHSQVAAFIDMLALLVIDPGEFRDEPRIEDHAQMNTAR